MEIHKLIIGKIKSGLKIVLGMILAIIILAYLWTYNIVGMILKR